MYVTVMGSEMLGGHICMCKGLLGPGLIASCYTVCCPRELDSKYQIQLLVISSMSISLENNIGKVTVTSDKTLW